MTQNLQITILFYSIPRFHSLNNNEVTVVLQKYCQKFPDHLCDERAYEVVLEQLCNVGDDGRRGRVVVRLEASVRQEHWRVVVDVCDYNVEQH